MSTLSKHRKSSRRLSREEVERGSALAVLLSNDRYVMQLRDDRPGISDPGVWALFGGRIEPGETPGAALVREIQEELGIHLTGYRFIERLECDNNGAATLCPYWAFEADITPLWGRHQLTEGQGVDCFSFEELQGLTIPLFIRGILERHYSEKTFQGSHSKSPCLK
jgi:8-oxo-dGTP pyrophosphatase MutT (NUDIX family)